MTGQCIVKVIELTFGGGGGGLARRLQVRVPIRSLNFFNLPKPSIRSMALGLTQHLTEMFLGSRAEHSQCIGLTTSPPFAECICTACK
jgi:hypothetical protein